MFPSSLTADCQSSLKRRHSRSWTSSWKLKTVKTREPLLLLTSGCSNGTFSSWTCLQWCQWRKRMFDFVCLFVFPCVALNICDWLRIISVALQSWFSSGQRSGEIPSGLPLCAAHSSQPPPLGGAAAHLIQALWWSQSSNAVTFAALHVQVWHLSIQNLRLYASYQTLTCPPCFCQIAPPPWGFSAGWERLPP